MRITDGLSPKKVFYYFEEISKIPRGSGNTKAIKSISEIREWTKYRALGRPIHLANKKFRQFAVVLETYSRRRSRSDRNRTHRPIQRTARGTQTFRQSQRLKAEGISMQSQGKYSTLP